MKRSARDSAASRALLARAFDFDAELLVQAIRATFERLKTALPETTPVALTSAFADDMEKQAKWSGFVRKAAAGDAGILAETIAAVRALVEPPLAAAAREGTTSRHAVARRWTLGMIRRQRTLADLRLSAFDVKM